MQAEMWGVVRGLQIAVANNFKRLIIEMDSSSVFEFVRNSCTASHPYASILIDINIHAQRLDISGWLHTLREANYVVDTLAKKGHTLLFGLHIFDVPPPDISLTLDLDCFGILCPRGS
ncbi:Putative ribonuclease H protein [Arachis hypogaea]|nr:Putative ribonuclease H protein [Arachis hypogaea]